MFNLLNEFDLDLKHIPHSCLDNIGSELKQIQHSCLDNFNSELQHIAYSCLDNFDSDVKCVQNSFTPDKTDIVIDPNYVHTDHNLTDTLYQILINRKLHSFCYWLFKQEDDFFFNYFNGEDFGLIYYELDNIKEELSDITKDIQNIQDNKYIVRNEINKLTLDTNYFVEQNIIYPSTCCVIKEFELIPAVYFIEPGKEQIYTAFTHKEINFNDTDSNVTFELTLENNIVKSNIVPASSVKQEIFEPNLSILTNEPKEIVLTLSSNSFPYVVNSTIYIKSVFPSFIGSFVKESITVTQLETTLQKVDLNKDLVHSKITITIQDIPKFVYLCIPKGKYIQYITLETFKVPLEYKKTITGELNGIVCEYNCYRTSSRLIPGTYEFVVN